MACHILLERSWWRLQLCFRPHLNWGSTKEIMGFQSCENPNFKNFGTPNLKIPGQNDMSVWALWPCIENTINGKVVASPKFGPWWVLWVYVAHGSFVNQKCSNTLVNLLFGLCKFVWIIESLVICSSPHPKAPTCPSTSEVLQVRKWTPIFYPFCCSWIY